MGLRGLRQRAVYPSSTPTLSPPPSAPPWFPGGSNGRTRNLIPYRRRRDTGARGGSMNVKPLADRILVRRIEEQEMKRGGILIPDTAKEKPQEGEVFAVGPGRMTD